jgi:glycosyltransferase involved in cell wall biosynthesis
MPNVSVVIPCFNQGNYITEALDSIHQQSHQDYEVIVVDDGSTEPETIKILREINHPKVKTIHTTNQGLASARNNGIDVARSEIVLPLDADDKIERTYMEKALSVFESHPIVGIVYCNPIFFGAKNGKIVLPEFSITRLLFENLIFCSAFFLKKEWKKVNGFNSNMKYGCEDWDFWLSMVANGNIPYRIPEFLFFYRKRKGSMSHAITAEQANAMISQVYLNHKEFYEQHALEFLTEIHRLRKLANTSVIRRLTFDKFLHPVQTAKNLIDKIAYAGKF